MFRAYMYEIVQDETIESPGIASRAVAGDEGEKMRVII